MNLPTEPWEFKDYHFTWPVYSRYEIVEIANPIPLKSRKHWSGVVPDTDVLVVVRPAKGSRERTWEPLLEDASAGLFTELAKLGTDFSPKQVLRFASRVGLLGMVEHYNISGLDWVYPAHKGEPLVFWERETVLAARLLSLYDLLRSGNYGALQYRVDVAEFNTSEGTKANIFIDGDAVLDWPILSVPVETETIARAGWLYLCKQINRHLEGRITMGCAAIQKRPDGFRVLPGVGCTSLLAAVYLHFRDMVIRAKELRRCVYCGALFEPTREDQKVCPKLPTEEKAPCANRYYVAKSRAKRRGSG